MCVSVCVCERGRERECVCVCVCEGTHRCVCFKALCYELKLQMPNISIGLRRETGKEKEKGGFVICV